MKASVKRSIKILLTLVGAILLVILSVLGFTIFRVRTTLNSLSQIQNTSENIQNTQKISPFSRSVRFQEKNIIMNENIYEKPKKEATVNGYSVSRLKGKSEFKLEGLITVLNSELGELNLCGIECSRLDETLKRARSYGKGNLKEGFERDQAFQLAIRLNQAGLGPAGREALFVIHEIQTDPSSIKSIAELGKLFWRVDEITKAMAIRKNTRAHEADELMEVLASEAKNCELNKWDKTCSILEDEINSWLIGGALQ